MNQARKEDLERQGYRLVGNHSAIKVCMWCKEAIRGKGNCYKQKFYGINSHQCVQMTPAMHVCSHRCQWCWRDIGFTKPEWEGPVDEPEKIVDGCIKEHVKFLQGFAGSGKKDEKKYEEAMQPKHFAISLSGEPTLYPKLPELIDEINSRGMTSFLVTNGTNPEMLKKLKGHEPTQLYITLPAPNEEIYTKACSPLIGGAWKKIQDSLKMLAELDTRKTIRLTLAKDVNMFYAKQYAEIFKQTDADFFELKAYMWVGHSRERMHIDNMPSYKEIKEFAEQIAKQSGLKIIDEKKESRVVLLAKKNTKTKL